MRRRGLRSAQLQITNCKSQVSQRGYILITMMLFLALLAIAAMAVMPEMAFQIKRDREEEMIHRAVAYSRAVKRYYRKFGRYPSRLEELENTNNVRFLRKRYQDPITGKDFKILHLSDVMKSLISQPGGNALNPQQGNTLNPNPLNPKLTPDTALAPPTNAGDQSAQDDNSGAAPSNPTATSPRSGSPQSPSPNPVSGPGGSSPGGQIFGGGPILGVASTSKAKTIRVFNEKIHYNEWVFIYDPASDRGGLPNGPVQPGLNPGSGTPGQVGVLPGMVPPSGQPGGITPPSQGPPNPPQMPPDQ